MNTFKKILVSSSALFLVPLLSFAQITIGSNVSALEDNLSALFGLIAPILIAVVVIYLLYGAFLFALAGGDETKREKGKSILLYGLIGVFLLVSVIGLINFVLGSVDFQGGNDPIQAPDFPGIE